MQFTLDSNRTPTDAQATERVRELRVWMLRNGVTFPAMGQHMRGVTGRPVTGSAVQKAIKNSRMPVDNHKALVDAYPGLPTDLLPLPENRKSGPPPKNSTAQAQ